MQAIILKGDNMAGIILTWEEYFSEHTHQQKERTIRSRLRVKGIILPGIIETDESADPVTPYVNDSRWIVTCPDCLRANHLAREDELFMCNNCGNVKINHKNRIAPFPKNRIGIERILVLRPFPENRHWTTETLDELKKENIAHGDPIPSIQVLESTN